MNRKMIIYTLGRMLMLEGILLLLPALTGFIYAENQIALIYLGVAIFTAVIGYVLSCKEPKNNKIYSKEGFVIAALSWTVLSVFGALPFYFTGEMPNYFDAFFEIVSGFTTTGSSILVDVEAMSHATLFWRSFSHWVGGMGILVFVVAIFPESSGTSLHFLRAEMPGPIVGKLVSKIKITAQILYKIYFVMTVVEVILLIFAGMPVFDSLLHAFGTAGTGGFGIKGASVGYYNSVAIDYIITIFMFLFGINFNIYYFLLLKQFSTAFKNEELKWYVGIVLSAAILISINTLPIYGSFMNAFRYASFQVSSIITTTGYSTVDFCQWPMFSQAILCILMFCGACAGSTGGGMKVSRVVIGCKNLKKVVTSLIHPNAKTHVRMDGETLEDGVVNSISAYFVIYFLMLFGAFLIVSLDNMDFESTMSAVITCLNNIGPGFGAIVGPVGNFSSLSNLSKLVLSFTMLAGRLEFYPFLVLLWKKD